MHFEYSIVATTYNDEKSIIDYLNSISKQSLLPKEIIITDGGSTDNTVILIQQFIKKINIPIKVISGRRLNISEGYNIAIKEASYSWIGITGIGNLYNSNYFETLYKHTESYDVCYSLIRGMRNNLFSQKYADTFLEGNSGHDIGMPSNHGCLIKKHIFEDNGYFYENFVYAGEDAEFYEIVKKKEYKMIVVPEAYAYWHIPTTMNAYIRQVKNYTIGDMQRKKNTELILSCLKKFMTIIAAIAAFFYIYFYTNLLIKISISGLASFYLLLWKACNKKKSILLLLYSKYAPAFYIVFNHKYLSMKYKVNRPRAEVDG